jgi:signal transduction histidine kinase/DNA-binding response OmpR family regulator/streptogramin lyase
MYFSFKKPNVILFISTVFWIFSNICAFSQYKYETLTTSDGLSQGFISDILQDKDGFMWFATKAGLNRYDGYTFKVFAHDGFDKNTICSNDICCLFEDSKGRIWIGSNDNGISVYDKKNDVFCHLFHDPQNQNSISGNTILNSFIEMADGKILTYASTKGIDIIDLPDISSKEVQPTIVHLNTQEKTVQKILFKDDKGIIWYLSNSKLYRFNLEKKQFEWYRDKTPFNHFLINKDGTIWTNDENYSLMDHNIDYPLFTKSVSNRHSTEFYSDINGFFWIGILDENKMQIFDIKKWERGKPLNPDACLMSTESNISAKKMMKDISGALWIGTNGLGIRKYTFESEKFKFLTKGFSIRKIISLGNNEITLLGWGHKKSITLEGKNLKTEVFDDKEQNMFISKNGTQWKLILKHTVQSNGFVANMESYNPKTKIAKHYDLSFPIEYTFLPPIIEDNKGDIWTSCINNIVVKFDPNTGGAFKYDIKSDNKNLPLAVTTALFEDSQGVFWMGTENGLAKILFNKLLNSSPSVKWYRNNMDNKNSINSNQIASILDDPNDNNFLWISTKGGGLNRLNKSTEEFVHITTNEGLCNNVVYGILSDTFGNLWGSTNKGIFCLLQKKNEEKTWNFRHFTKADGLQDDEFNTGAYLKLPNGSLAFGGVNGLNIFNPAEVLQNGFTPNVFITNIMVGNQPVFPNDKTGVLKESIEYTKSITLNHLQDILTLEFSSLDYTNPLQNKYRYQLEGIDKDWIESGTRRSATYLHLPSGNFVFKLQGSNSQGIWSDKIAQLTIIVLPPWWATWWAILFYLAILVLSLRTYFKYKLNKTKIETQLVFEQNEAKRIKELDKAKTQLYTNMTHEFRTPLTVILGMVKQIKNAPKEHFGNGLEMIERNGKNLLNLVNEMLDLSKLEAGKMELNFEKGDVIQFLRYIVESFHSMAESQGKQMHYLASIDTLNTEYDAEKLRQILSNILSNALKFTKDKGNIYITISSSAEHIHGNKKILILKVKDTGSGIPEDQLLHIFDRFYQVDNSHTRNAEGTGIGLALTKELVQLMEGTIEVKSPPIGSKIGTEFTVTLPMIVVELNNVLSIKPNEYGNNNQITSQIPVEVLDLPSRTNNSSELILLVEDNADVVAYTASCLPEYRLAVGRDGQEGFDIACTLIPDLIITDVMMPFVDGFEMSKRLRKDERTSHIPIIILTAKADIESKLEGLDYGADAYLEKPFYKEELKLRIKKLLEQRRLLQKIYSNLSGIQKTKDIPNDEIKMEEEGIKTIVIPKIENEFVKKVREEIEKNLSNESFSVELLSKNIFMSHSQVHRKLSALIGHSPNQFIRTLRMQKAKELLKTTDESITNISSICGYSDVSYFGKVFKQEFGITAFEYRNK